MSDHSIIKRLRIAHIVTETAFAKTFVLEPLDGWTAQYKAGQFVTLIFNTSFGEKRRSYSVSSSPELNEPLSITVKRMTNGEFSRPLIDYSREGDILLTSGITGFFCLPEQMDDIEQVFFLAAGSGITPCFSLIKTILVTTDKNILLVYSNRSIEDTIFYQAIQLLQQHYGDRLRILFLFSNNKNLVDSRLNKWLLEKILEEFVKEKKENALFYLCGPYNYMQMATISLLTYGIPRNNIKKEVFDFLPRISKPKPPDTDPHQVRIHINNNIHNLAVQYPNTILSAAKTNNIELPYSCEAGRCGSCAATCIKGKIWMAYNEVLMDNEIEKGRVLTCQGYPVGGNAEIVF